MVMTHPIGVSTAYFPAEWRAALTTVDDAVKRVFLSRIVAVVLLAALCPQFLHGAENFFFDNRLVGVLYIILLALPVVFDLPACPPYLFLRDSY